ncbi:MAG: alcohol dehydrogenase catalytic domain-containing protein [Polyangiales bacterium]
MIRAYAAHGANESLEPFEYDPGDLGRGHVEIDVLACGVCHSDLSVANNDWGFSQYPIVPGHEVVGTIGAVGEGVSSVSVGDTSTSTGVSTGTRSGQRAACTP